MHRLQWDIEAVAERWAKAQTGEWWEKKVEVEIIISSGWPHPMLSIDAEPHSVLPIGPAWREACQNAISELLNALGKQAPIIDSTAPAIQPLGATLVREEWSSHEWQAMEEAASASAPNPAPVATATLAKLLESPGGGGGGGGGAGGGGVAAGAAAAGGAVGKGALEKFTEWVVKGVRDQLVVIGIGKLWDAIELPEASRVRTGKLVYNSDNQKMYIHFKNGEEVIAPIEYQPHP